MLVLLTIDSGPRHFSAYLVEFKILIQIKKKKTLKLSTIKSFFCHKYIRVKVISSETSET